MKLYGGLIKVVFMLKILWMSHGSLIDVLLGFHGDLMDLRKI